MMHYIITQFQKKLRVLLVNIFKTFFFEFWLKKMELIDYWSISDKFKYSNVFILLFRDVNQIKWSNSDEKMKKSCINQWFYKAHKKSYNRTQFNLTDLSESAKNVVVSSFDDCSS